MRGIDWSLELLGRMPSLSAAGVSPAKQWETLGGGGGVVHSFASGPLPMTGKEVMRRWAALDGDGVLILLPGAHDDLARELEGDGVAVFPLALDDQVTWRVGFDRDVLIVHANGG